MANGNQPVSSWAEIADMLQIDSSLSQEQREEKAKSLTGTFAKQRQEGKKRDTAVAEATKRLKKAHKTDYTKFLNEELTKVGLPVKS